MMMDGMSESIGPDLTKSQDPLMVASRLFVGNLPSEQTHKQELVGRFGKYGPVAGVAIFKGFGFVQYADPNQAKQAADAEHGTLLHGQRLGPDNYGGGGYNYPNGRGYSASGYPPPQPMNFQPNPARFAPPGPSVFNHPPPQNEPPLPLPLAHQYQQPHAPRPPSPAIIIRSTEHESHASLKKNDIGIEKPYDCAVLVCESTLRDYGEMVERKLRELNLSVDVLFLTAQEEKIGLIVEQMAHKGMLYVVLVQKQHEKHKSITLNVLYGSPQEHRNMPLEDALVMLSRDFSQYLNKLRVGSEQPSLSFLLHLLADSKHLGTTELERIAQHLEERKSKVLLTSKETSSPNVTPAAASVKPGANINASSNAANLQQHLMSILGTGGGGSSSSAGSSNLFSQQNMAQTQPNPNRGPPVSSLLSNFPSTAQNLFGAGNQMSGPKDNTPPGAGQGMQSLLDVGPGEVSGTGAPSGGKPDIQKALAALLKNPDLVKTLKAQQVSSGMATSLANTVSNTSPTGGTYPSQQQQPMYGQQEHGGFQNNMEQAWNRNMDPRYFGSQ